MTGQPQAPAANRPALSPDQADAWDALAETFQNAGVDLVAEEISPPKPGKGRVMAVIGKAGSGKTLLLSEITRALREAGVDLISADYEGRRRKDRRTVAILAPTNKAAFVLRTRGVPATTITVINTIGLRVNPTIESDPFITTDNKFGNNDVWQLDFEVEFEDALTVEMMVNDFMLVPFITGLSETETFEQAVFITKGKNTNIIFDTE